MLVDHRDAQRVRLGDTAHGHDAAADADLAGVARRDPGEDLHQRRLAGPVFPEQGVDLASPNLQVDAVVRDDRSELLPESLNAQQRRVRTAHPPLR